PTFNLWAVTTTTDQAATVVAGWLKSDSTPLDATLGRVSLRVDTYVDAADQPLYYIVNLDPDGFVIVPADDQVEPIIGFVSTGSYDPSLDNPLGALVSMDLSARVTDARNPQGTKMDYLQQVAQDAENKWDNLTLLAGGDVLEMGIGSVSDVRVSPFVQSRWSQQTECSNYCYNYYAPNHYPCGCVATAAAQVMRFYQHPTAGIGVHGFTIEVDGLSQTAYTRGGDGSGGPYNWGDMVLDPDCSTTLAQHQAIGALCYDAGVSVGMDYASAGSGADTMATKDALTSTFGYSNARKGYNSGSNIGAGLNGMVNPNLDAGLPVIFGITGSSGGHAILTDGYGYNSSTLYHHLNMGWAGSSDAWYDLPSIVTTSYTFTSVYKCVYNIYVSGSGEIISGRVTDLGGNPVSGVSIVGQRSGGGTYNDTTDANGIYALAKVPSSSSYTITATKAGHLFAPQNVTTSTSTDYGSTSGNRWAISFVDTVAAPPIASNDSVTTGQDTPIIVSLQATDDGQPDPPGVLTYIITSLPDNGSLSDPGGGVIVAVPYALVGNGNQVVYSPDGGYIGPDAFGFKANDGGTAPDGGDSNIATISIDVANSVTITIGTGTFIWDYPMHTYWHDSRTQVIYLASEIGISGTISDLALDVETVPGQTMDNWTIRMKHTSLDSYSTASLEATDWVVVYQGNEPTGVTGWRSFAFSTTFDYNGTDNLLIDFSHNNSSYTTSGMCRYSDSGVIRSAYAYTDSGYGDPLDWSGTTSPTVSASTFVPNVKLTIGGGGVSDPPAEPNNPDPNDGAIDVLVDTNLTWNVPGTPGVTGSLTTTFAGGNGQDGCMFDLTAKETITITGWEGNISAAGGSATIEVYYVTDHTSFVGKETNPALWTLLGSVTLPSTNPVGTPTVVTIGGLTIASGETVGIYWTTTASTVSYTDGPLGVFENAELRFEDRGTGNAYPFDSVYSPRVWNGTIHYEISDGSEISVGSDTSGVGDTTWDVYFGTENPPTALVCADLTESTCDPGLLQYCTTYFWQVVAKNSYGETPGETWSFTTRFADMVDLELFVSHWLDTDCSDSAGDESDWCFGTDLDKSTVVDFSDYATLSLYWLECSE
ncbi:MAG: C10 family peptidase, partial [Planctomycetes bacterium]|nr:C10 family peptidase [Planctomycetota bacterium]